MNPPPDIPNGRWYRDGLTWRLSGPRPVDETVPPAKRRKPKAKSIEQMHALGWSDKQMAEHLDISVAALRKRRLRRGIRRTDGWSTAECGTPAGHQRHRREGTKPCDDCRAARNKYAAEWKRQRERTAA